jgi:pyrroline-5-carboxylate reductase
MKVLLIGCGHMGGAMLAGWLRQNAVTHVDVVEPTRPGTHSDARVTMHASTQTISGQPDMAVLAVKPQVMNAVCADLAPRIGSDVPVLSIAAGITLATLIKHFNTSRALIRAMPNTPGAIGEGITGYVSHGKIDQKQQDAIAFLLGVLGDVVQVSDEAMIDAVTGVSGSGPAYIFALTEAMEKAGVANGLSLDIAKRLARQTVIGAAALMAAQSDVSPEDLRRAVTSPGGTTAAALDVLAKNQALNSLFEEAISAAVTRSRDLAQSQ